MLHLLPFVEEQALFDQFEEMVDYRTDPYPGDEAFDFDTWITQPGRERLMAERPGIYRCPSDASPDVVEGEGGAGAGIGGGEWSLASYALVAGSMGMNQFNPQKYTNDGLFSYSLGLPLSKVTDGMSKTLMIGEQRGRFSGRDADEIEANNLLLEKDNFWQIGLGGRWAMVNTFRTINHSIRTDYGVGAFVDWVNSEHPGGANLAFGDGRVEFLSENIDLQVYWALGTRQGPLYCDGDRPSYLYGISPGCGSLVDEDHNYE